MIESKNVDPNQFQRDGWTKIGNGGILTNEELTTLRTIAREAVAKEDTQATLAARRAAAESSEKAKTVFDAESADNRYQMMFKTPKEGFDLRLNYPQLKPIVKKYGEVARRLVGEDVRIWWDTLMIKPPQSEGTRPTMWHQDSTYVPADRRGQLTIWTALYDVPEECGCMRFIPRSHRLGPLGKIPMTQDYDLKDLLRPTDLEVIGEPVTIPVKAGEATVHDGFVIHGARPNLSDRPRVVWATVFGPASALWAGSKHPVERVNHLGLKELAPFDHPTLMAD